MPLHPEFRFKTIVVATYPSEPASSALQYARAVAKMHGARLVITDIVDPVDCTFSSGLSEATNDSMGNVKPIRRNETTVRSRVDGAVVCDRVLQSVIEARADLLILGTDNASRAGRTALGTVVRQLLARTPCPVLTVSHGAECHIPRGGGWPRVLVATDFSAASLEALAFAHNFTFDELAVLHAVPGNECMEHKARLEYLRFLAPFNELHTVPVEHIVDSCEAAELIVYEATCMDANLVMLGTPLREPKQNELASSTILNVISHVRCPVMCIPSSAEATIPISQHKIPRRFRETEILDRYRMTS